MPALLHEHKAWSPLEAIAQWYRDWSQRRAAAELSCCGEEAIDRMAREVGLTAAELRQLAKMGPEAAGLLQRRMASLSLDPNEVGKIEPQTLHDLQRVCSLCQYHRRCARDLAHDAANPAWKNYCPNAATLAALNAEPWTARAEW